MCRPFKMATSACTLPPFLPPFLPLSLSRVSALFVPLSKCTLLLFLPQSVVGVFTHPLSTLSHSIFTASPSFSTLYSLHVYISLTGKSWRLSPCQYLCFGECCPLSPAFYHLNISSDQLIYFPTLVFSFSLSSFSPLKP